MNKKPFFSVVIPTLNEELFLPKLLDDLVKQKEKDFEVVIVDGFSQDKTSLIVKDYQKKLSINFFQNSKKNVSSQRNFGALKAKGEYLVFLDADSRINSSFLKKVKKFIEKNKGLIFLPYILPDKKFKLYKPLFDISNILVELSQNLPKKFSLGGSIIIERNFFQTIGGFDETLFIAEDHELVQRASSWGVKTKFIKDAYVYFSLRRIKKEGEFRFFYKYFIATTKRLLSNEEIKKKIFDYQMGGHLYQDKKDISSEYFFKKYLKEIKKFFKKIILS